MIYPIVPFIELKAIYLEEYYDPFSFGIHPDGTDSSLYKIPWFSQNMAACRPVTGKTNSFTRVSCRGRAVLLRSLIDHFFPRNTLRNLSLGDLLVLHT
ncbi:MAG: hypothetical protein CMH46_16470 [Muricauda sp.]|nr:hypothetical protein [Allomuricauda sp.]MAU17123.1 hypothetical protein [Allomuricauda sp.]